MRPSVLGIGYTTIVVLLASACAVNPGYNSNQASTSGNGFTAAPTLVVSNPSPPVGAIISLSGSGGTPPYSYFISTGDGSINTTNNTYIAPSNPENVTLGIKDSTGYYGYLNISVVSATSGSGVLNISPL